MRATAPIMIRRYGDRRFRTWNQILVMVLTSIVVIVTGFVTAATKIGTFVKTDGSVAGKTQIHRPRAA